MTKHYTKLYGKKYFEDRVIVDPKREAMYQQELSRLKKIIPKKGRVLDIGCGLGEFLILLDKSWDKYGTEISEFAIKEASKKGVKFNIPDKNDFFDLIIFRGTIQHINSPFFEMEKRIKQLRKGGYMVFLATPNAGGLYFRIFQDLPMLYPEKNFFIPSDKVLTQSLKNFGLKIKKIYYPYFETPYAKPATDHILFFLRLFGITNKKHAFPGNMMEIYAQKP